MSWILWTIYVNLKYKSQAGCMQVVSVLQYSFKKSDTHCSCFNITLLLVKNVFYSYRQWYSNSLKIVEGRKCVCICQAVKNCVTGDAGGYKLIFGEAMKFTVISGGL